MSKETKEVTIRLKKHELKMAAYGKGVMTNLEIAEAIGVSSSQFNRVWKGQSPGPKFIAGVLDVFGGPFERFFLKKCESEANQEQG